MNPTYSSELRDALLRQEAYLQTLEGGRLLAALPSFVELLASDPTLHAVAEDLLHDAAEQVRLFAEHDAQGIAELTEFWSDNSSWILKLWNEKVSARQFPAMEARGNPSLFESYIVAKDHALPSFEEPTADPTVVGTMLTRITFWIDVVREPANAHHPELLANARKTIAHIEERHARALARYLVTGIAHAGVAALWRIHKTAAGLLPTIVGWDPSADVDTLLDKAAGWWLDSQVALAVFPRQDDDRERQSRYVAQARRDVALATVEIVRRVGLSLSYRALVQRFKTRCERFDVELLRRALETRAPGESKEDLLTKACAAYLFDQGLNPLFNVAATGRLRPDIIDASGRRTLYVEAKQYSSADDLRLIRRASWQVWSTWSELEGPFRVSEGFLLVFRLGGPLAVLDRDVRFQNRSLHPLVVDLAPGSARGHAEKDAPIRITSEEMIPRSIEQSPI